MSVFAAWGRFVFRRRIAVLVTSVLLLAVSGLLVARGGTLSAVITADVESVRALSLLERELPRPGKSSFQLVFQSKTLLATDAEFQADLLGAIAELAKDPRVAAVIPPRALPPPLAAARMSTDGHGAIVEVWLKDDLQKAGPTYAALRAKVKPRVLSVLATGPLAEQEDFDRVLEQDLVKAELVSVPLTAFVLLAVFGSVVATLLPVGIGLFAVLGGVAALFTLSRVTPVSPYAMNVVTLIGLGVAIDYSLFIVSRFREELARGASTEDAVVEAVATSGRAVAFAGLAVTIGLAGLLFYRGMFLDVIGIAAAIVVALSVLFALTSLPALLGVLGPRVDRLRIPLVKVSSESPFYRRVAARVMEHPVLVLLPTLALLVAAGLPFFGIRTANSDVTVLPTTAEARQGYDELAKGFPGQDPSPIVVLVQFPGNPLEASRIGALHDLVTTLRARPGVLRVDAPVAFDPRLPKEVEAQLLAAPRAALPPELAGMIGAMVGPTTALVTVRSAHPPTSEETRALVKGLRASPVVGDGRLVITGRTAVDLDLFEFVKQRTPRTVGFVMGMTFVVLLFALRSVLLPLKAVVMNVLSITASFGALVWVFQRGHLSSVLRFTPGPIEPVLPVLLFCLVFGLSMDYEVLLLTRMQEEWDHSADNRRAVAEGLAKSAPLITSAAVIMVVVFAAFAMARVVLIQAIGLGMALAVALDATLVRTLVVPATMRLFGDANWWAPSFLRRR